MWSAVLAEAQDSRDVCRLPRRAKRFGPGRSLRERLLSPLACGILRFRGDHVMRRPTLLAALFVMPAGLAAQPAQSDWRVAASDIQSEAGHAAGGSVGFVDLVSMSRNGDRVSFTLEVHFLNQRDASGPDTLLSHMQAECAARRWSTTDTTIYRNGAEVDRAGTTPPVAVDPGTNGYAIVTAVCTGQFRTGPISDRAAYARSLLAPR
jgi:hypothetical protein